MRKVYFGLFQNLKNLTWYAGARSEVDISMCSFCRLLSSKHNRPLKLYLKLFEISDDLGQIRAKITQAVNNEYNSFSNAL